VSEQLGSEKLSNTVALGVLAPDMISSSAYGTEEMLAVLVPAIGLGGFTMVLPITVAILAVLTFVTFSYFQVIKVYNKQGGSYVVARDNFGPRVAQVAAVALLIDYTVTVAIQTSAGTNALTSAFPALLNTPFNWTVPITVAVTLLMFYGNLRGIREAGVYFAIPTYFFVASLGVVIVGGFIKEVAGALHQLPAPTAHDLGYTPGATGTGALMGLSLFFLLQAFANGGASLTGLEAVSDGIGSFRKPRSRNGRKTLLAMCFILAFLVVGTSLMAHWTHPFPYKNGAPTVVSQEVQAVFGSGLFFYIVQFATMMILFTGGNTSFNGFPWLASFVAGDSFLPRALTKRGHRLAFSNGIFALTGVAIVLIVAFRANVNSLVSLYAIGVFTGFTFAGSGMVKYNLKHRGPKWKFWVAANGFSAVMSFAVVGILAVTKFFEGAWIILFVAPPMYWGLLRLRKQYDVESTQLESGVAAATEARVLPHHVVVVMIDQLDLSAARAIQYARSLRPEELRAVHFDIDDDATNKLKDEWSRLGLARVALDLIECRDRRVERASIELVAELTADGETQCTVLLPRRAFNSGLKWILHDRTADKIADAVSGVEHVAATIVPYGVSASLKSKWRPRKAAANHKHETKANGRAKTKQLSEIDEVLAARATGTTPISAITWRERAQVAGRVRSVRVQSAKGTANLECVLTDDTGDLLLVFQGRPQIPGIEPGARLIAKGTVSSWHRDLAILNPDYELVAGSEGSEA
jgi:amino acid transporter